MTPTKRPSPTFYRAAPPARPPAPSSVPPADEPPTAGDPCWGCGKVGGPEGCEGLCPIPRSRMRGMVEEIARLTVEVQRLRSLVDFQQTTLNARDARDARRSEAKTVALPVAGRK